MKSVYFYVIFSMLVFGSCSTSRINQEQASTPYPTVFDFKSRPEEFGEQFKNAYYKNYKKLGFYLEDFTYTNPTDIHKISDFQAKDKGLFGEENKYDVWMRFSSDSSGVFFSRKGEQLKFTMECKAHVIQIGADSIKVAIQVLDSKAQVGESKIPTAPHFVNNPIYRKVEPPTKELYKILLCYGTALGMSDKMPKL